MKPSSPLLQCLAMGSLLAPLVTAKYIPIAPRDDAFGDLVVVGDHNTSLVQTLYNRMNGSFQLDPDLLGSEARLHSIWLGDSVNALKSMGSNAAATNHTSVKREAESESSLEKRSDTMSVQTVQCIPTKEIKDSTYFILTYEQQIYFTSLICSYVLDLTADAWGVAGLIATNVKCGAKLQTTCNVVLTVAAAEAGTQIGTYMQEWCVNSFDTLFNYCIERGGAMEVYLTATGKEFDVGSFAVNSILSCPSDSACYTYKCNGNCNPGGLLPSAI